MKNVKLQATLYFLIFYIFGMTIGFMASRSINYSKGYNEALDDMIRIMDNQIGDTTSVSIVGICSKTDTTVYVLKYK